MTDMIIKMPPHSNPQHAFQKSIFQIPPITILESPKFEQLKMK